MVDHRRPICPRPPSRILKGGCITNGPSLPHVLPTGCLTNTNTATPRLALAVPFMMRNGISAVCKDQQAAGLLPPSSPGGPILLGARARAECAYQDWKGAINALWADKCHRLFLLDKEAARACQQAACCQHLLDEEAASARQEAAHARRQQLLDKDAARARQVAAALHQRLLDDCVAEEGQKQAAAQTIFLWLCCRRLHIQIARQTSRRQQREATLARLRYEQECCNRAALAKEKRRQAVAAREQAVANKITERLRQAEEALGVQCQEEEASAWANALAEVAVEQRSHEAAAASAELALVEEQRPHEAAAASVELALVEEHRRHEASLRAALSAATSLADEQRRHEAAALAAELAELALAEERCRLDAATQMAMSAASSLATERRHHETAAQAAESAALLLAEERR
jgi:hypothetical protein